MNTPVTIRLVHSWRDRQRFIRFPYTLYRESLYWTPPLRRDQAHLFNPRKNPFFDHGTMQLFLAIEKPDRVVGRIAAIVNGRHLQKYEDGVGFFGFFECAEHYDIAHALLDAAGYWLLERGLTAMRGPTNPSVNETSGILVDGFDRAPSIMMPYNPPYYAEYVQRYGFERVMTMWAYFGAWKYMNLDRLRRGVALIQRRMPQLRVRKLDQRRFTEEARVLHQLYNESFAAGWGQVPMTEAEFLHASSSMRAILDPDLMFCVERAGHPVGFSLSLPNVNPLLRHVPGGRLFPFGLPGLLLRSRYSDLRELRTILMGVVPAYQRLGLDAMLVLSTIEEARRNGYLASEMSWVMDDNVAMKNFLYKLGAVVDKEYALYEISLPQGGKSL